MHKSDAEKIDLILDEHDRIYRRQVLIYKSAGISALICGFACSAGALVISSPFLKYTLVGVTLVCVMYLIFMFSLLNAYIVLSRQTLLCLMRRVEDTADVRRELLRRLLSGKTLTGRDKDNTLRLWWESRNEVEELATRQREQDAIRKFVGGDKSE